MASIINKLKPLSTNEFASEAFDSSYLESFLRFNVCQTCPFHIDGCDFTSGNPPENCSPCGGLIVLSQALKDGRLDVQDVRLANLGDLGSKAILALSKTAALKQLENPHIYDLQHDELYEVNDDGFDFLKNCNGTKTMEQLSPEKEFIEFCVSEGLLDVLNETSQRDFILGKSPNPSLRYLEWLVTLRCNLKCSHCYLGDQKLIDFPEGLISITLDEFSLMQGLRILVSGGEPILYSHFGVLNELIPDYPVRFVLLSNGTLLEDRLVQSLNFHEVQISLDGTKSGHEMIRGTGTYYKVLRAMERIRNAGIDLSVATMIHAGNLKEFDEMSKVMENFGVREWNIDYPCARGRFEVHPELSVAPQEAAKLMQYGFGASYHGSSAGWTCGRHLVGILPDGKICRCGLFPDKVLGSIEEGLAKAWDRVHHIPIEATKCKGCDRSDDCGGGCRYRAGGPLERDPVMCALYGQSEFK